jgi:hypothetical protein
MGDDQRPTSEAETTRYIVWLVAGLAFLGYGIAALFQLYTAAPPAGVGMLPLIVALLCTVAGGYVVLAVFFNLWLPKPKVDRIRHHRKVSIAAAFALLVVAGLIGTQFPRKPTTVSRSVRSPSGPFGATKSPHSPRTPTQLTPAAVPLVTTNRIASRVAQASPHHATIGVTMKPKPRPAAASVRLAVPSPKIESPRAASAPTPSTPVAALTMTPNLIASRVHAAPRLATAGVAMKPKTRPTAARAHLAVASPKTRPTPKTASYRDENGNLKSVSYQDDPSGNDETRRLGQLGSWQRRATLDNEARRVSYTLDVYFGKGCHLGYDVEVRELMSNRLLFTKRIAGNIGRSISALPVSGSPAELRLGDGYNFYYDVLVPGQSASERSESNLAVLYFPTLAKAREAATIFQALTKDPECV